MNRRYRGFIFDMDGTLLDNMMVHHRIWQSVLSDLGISMTLDQVRRNIHGKNEEIFERLFGEALTPDQRTTLAHKKEQLYREAYQHEAVLLPGVIEFITTARTHNVPMAIGTAAPADNVAFIVSKFQLDHYFNPIVHSGHVSRGKPDPEVFLLAAAGLGVPPTECLVFEDSPTGVRTARNAHMQALVITTTHKPDEFAGFDNIIGFAQDFTHLKISGE